MGTREHLLNDLLAAPPAGLDYARLARKVPRASFVADHPCLFLVGPTAPGKIARPVRRSSPALDPLGEDSTRNGLGGDENTLVVAAVRKTQSQFPSMITLGRTANHDIVLANPAVSKFHAHFRLEAGVLTVQDAGSRNGTWVNETRLNPNEPHRVELGDTLRFAGVAVRVVTAAECWSFVRAHRAPPG